MLKNTKCRLFITSIKTVLPDAIDMEKNIKVIPMSKQKVSVTQVDLKRTSSSHERKMARIAKRKGSAK